MKELLLNLNEMGKAVVDSPYSSDNNTRYENHPVSHTNQEEDYCNDV